MISGSAIGELAIGALAVKATVPIVGLAIAESAIGELAVKATVPIVGLAIGELAIGELAVEVAVASIVSVDGDDTVADGQTGVAVIIANNVADATALRLATTTGGFTLTGLNFSGTAQDYTVDVPDQSAFADLTSGIPLSSGNWSHDFEVDVDATVPTLPGTLSSISGWTTVDVLNASVAEGSIFFGRPGGSPADTSQIYYPIAGNTTIDPTGIIETDLESVSGKLWDVDTALWEEFTVTITSVIVPIILNTLRRFRQ